MAVYLLLFVTGIVAGLYGANVGSGSLVTVPVLILVGLPIHTAIGTNRLVALFLEGTSVMRFHRTRLINLKICLLYGPAAAIGSLIGSHLVLNVPEKILKSVIAIIFIGIGFLVLGYPQLGQGTKVISKTAEKWGILGMLFLGIYGGFFGAAFGTMTMIWFAWLGLSLLQSAGTSRVIGLIMSTVATIVFIYQGVVHYPFGLTMGLGAAMGSWLGAGMGIKKGNRFIRNLLLMIIALSAIKLLSEALY